MIQWQEALPSSALEPGGQVALLEGLPGRERRAFLQARLGEAESRGARTWLLSCDFAESGVWSGVESWLRALLPEIEQEAPSLLAAHDYELTLVLPELRRRASTTRATLTDVSTGSEAVRNYAMDRAYRIGHGLVDLLDAWHQRSGGGEWVVACDSYGRSGALVKRFFRELMRRRGRKLGVTLVVAVDPGQAEEAAASFDAATPVHGARAEFRADPPEVRSAAEMTALAKELERQVGGNLLEAEIHLPQLIRYWSQSEHPELASRWKALALGLYNHCGFYEDALVHVDAVLENLDRITAWDRELFSRWNLVGAVCVAYMAVEKPERAYEVVMREAWEKIQDPADRARICYVLSMLHARFLPNKDFDAGERFLEQGLEELEKARMPAEDQHFLRVFLLNGLAFIRHRQGRAGDAITITQEGSRQLDAHLPAAKHRLHRSVLFFNLAQVYASVGSHDEAIASFTAAMEMDPNYSEYYNERGNVYLKMGRFDDAIRDFREAIRVSPPYEEVWTNLGQCYRQMRRWEDAVRSYSVALDLNPNQLLARVGRAQAYDAISRAEEALADFDWALAIDPAQPLVLSNRAVLLYDKGRLPEALADLDRAIGLSPDTPDLYRNRAVAFSELGRPVEAAGDLEAVLRLEPSAPDRAELEEHLSRLRQVAPAA